MPAATPPAHCDAGHKGAALAAGCRVCVGKPVDFELLTELVGRYACGS